MEMMQGFDQINIFIDTCNKCMKYISLFIANIASNANGTGRGVWPFFTIVSTGMKISSQCVFLHQRCALRYCDFYRTRNAIAVAP